MIPTSIIRLVRIYGAKLKKHLGKLYVISSDKAAYEEICDKCASSDYREEKIADIEPCLVEELSALQDESLENVIKETGANLVGAVLDSLQGVPTFLMMRSSKNTLVDDADIISFKIDKHNRDALSDMMENVAANDPESFCTLIDKTDKGRFALSVTRGGRKTAGQKAMELEQYSSKFVENMQVIRNSGNYSEEEVTRARYEVKTVVSNLTPAALGEFMYTVLMTGLIPDDDIIEERFLNLRVAAKKSEVQLVIRPRRKDEKIVNSDGKYHLTFSKGENSDNHIRFPGKVETAIYYTVMVARKNTDADKFEILGLEKEFIGIYRALYVTSYDKAKVAFDGIKDLVIPDGDNEIRYQGRYRNYIPNIRAAINEALGGIDNPAIYHYFYHYERGGHFYVDRDHIIIDEKFLKESERLKDPREQASFL